MKLFPKISSGLLLFLAVFSGCSREDSPSAKVGKNGEITFTATGGNPSASTKSSADASLSAGASAPSAVGGNSVEADRIWQIYYDFEKGENVEVPASVAGGLSGSEGRSSSVNGSSYDAAGNLIQSSDTRFNGEVFTVSSSSSGFSERIDWMSGDKLTIFECVSEEYATYTVKDVTSGSSDERSKASLESSTPLKWHDGSNHKFVAFYPSIDDLDMSSPTVYYNGNATPYYAHINGALNLIPATQYCTKVDGGRTYKGPTTPPEGTPEIWYEPDMKYAYMLSNIEVASSEVPKDDLSLAFYPQFSSVEVKLVKPAAFSSKTVKLKSAALKGGNGNASEAELSGNPPLSVYLFNMGIKLNSGASGGSITYEGDRSTTNKITLEFKDTDGATTDAPILDNTTPISFTFLTFPDNITQLELTLVLDIEGVQATRTLKLRRNNSWIPLPPGGKLTLTNMQSADIDITPLTIEPKEAGLTTITINNPLRLTFKYSINGASKEEKKDAQFTITAYQGDKVALYHDAARSLGQGSNVINFDKPCYVYGNIMSLASEKAYPDEKKTTINQFMGLFLNNANLLLHPDKPLLLPADTLNNNCYANMFQGCTGLTSAPELPARTKLDNGCYRSMFQDCTGLTSAPELPATSLAAKCYASMFSGCTNLTTAPELPAQTLKDECYMGMFQGCTSLEKTPALPAETIANRCYESMFQGCTSLKYLPSSLPATTLKTSCYNSMFLGCTSLTAAPALPAETLAEACYHSMFYGCTELGTAPDLPATTVAKSCYQSMFYKCTTLTNAPALPAETLAEACYHSMFYGCTELGTAPVLPATTVAKSCYQSMFYNCTSLSNAPALPAETLAEYCYYEMFKGCTGMTTAPASLPAKTLASYCCHEMFYGCTSLIAAPELPATTVAKNCYQSMFSNCTNMTTGPSSLPAETVASDCYASMFARCTNLDNAPELPAMNLADRCYFNMFWLCTKLNSAPALPATILAPSCYEQMFYGCSALTSAPDLPATASVNNCYKRMFYGCSLSSIKCYLLETNASDCVSDWFDGAPSSGTFWKNSLNTTWPTGASGIPTGWTVMDITP